MEEKPKILGLGAVCQDWVSVVDHFPEPDEKIDAISEQYFPGGVTANYITATQRLGVKSALIGAVGDDSKGDWLLEDMKNEGQYVKYCIKKTGMITGVNFILVNKTNGQKMIIQSPYFNSTHLQPEELKKEWFKGAKLLHTTAIFHDLTLKAIEYAKENNLMISLDLESQIAIRGMQLLEPIIKNVDILLPNKFGAMTLTKKNDPVEAAKEFIKMGVPLVVITLGEEGSMAITADEIIKAPIFKIKAVDATGAGDTFCGAFTFAYVIKKWNLKKCLTFGNACAAIKITKLGARTGMPTYQQAIDFLRNRNIKI